MLHCLTNKSIAMQTNKIMSASLIDLIFDGHNKDYGAYELRKNYSKRINKAIIITLTIAAVICSTVMLASTSKNRRQPDKLGPEVLISKLDEQPVKPLPEPEPEVREQPRTEAYTAPAIKPDDVVVNTPPTQEELETAVIGTETIDGPVDNGVPQPVGELDGNRGVVEQRPNPEPEEPYRSVEVDAQFSGNWRAFLESNLNADVVTENSAPAGRYTVVIEFVVDKEGKVSDVVALTNHGYGMEAEAIRVIKKSKSWEPAIQNGRKVKAYRRQPIVFEVLE